MIDDFVNKIDDRMKEDLQIIMDSAFLDNVSQEFKAYSKPITQYLDGLSRSEKILMMAASSSIISIISSYVQLGYAKKIPLEDLMGAMVEAMKVSMTKALDKAKKEVNA